MTGFKSFIRDCHTWPKHPFTVALLGWSAGVIFCVASGAHLSAAIVVATSAQVVFWTLLLLINRGAAA